MFTPKGLFAEITCPFNNTCTLPHCLFTHSRDAPSDFPVRHASKPVENALDGVENNKDGQRKRQKLESPNATVPGIEVENIKAGLRSQSSLKTIIRPVSPPPLRRQVIKSPNPPVTRKVDPFQSTPEPSPKPPPKTCSKLAKTAELQTIKSSLKVESLNPRLVNHSPASHDIRYRLVKALHEQLSRLNNELRKDVTAAEESLILSDQELIRMALDIEQNIAIEMGSIYGNLVKNKILFYKRMTVFAWKEERQTERKQAEILRGKNVPTSKTPESPKPIEKDLTLDEELEFLPKLYTPLDGMSKHGYVVSIPAEDSINEAKKGIEAAKGWEICDRCKSRFQVFPGRREDGALTSGGSCTHHWGKSVYQEKDPKDPKAKRQRRYRCCGELVGDSAGCAQADTHVFKVSEAKRLAAIMSFAETPPNDSPSKTPVCIDGEMGYTVHGLELIRLTATSWPNGDELLDVLVRPIGEVLDLNSRWSGVWPEQMADAIPWEVSSKAMDGRLRVVSSPAVARDLLFRHLSPETPLIGHGLENDLNAARIIHPTVIDTCLLFPHKAGLPYRNGLKMLMQLHLKRTIQAQIVTNGKMEGHDSKEDARAAGDLVTWKISQKWAIMKAEGWRLESGKFVAPISVSGAPKGLLTVEYLEAHEAGANSSTNCPTELRKLAGTKRPIDEISGNDFEKGVVDGKSS